jgi:Zn-dependent alcohol dehydrogenase
LGPRLPIVPGHESSGYVEELGEGVTSVKPGDPVAVSLLASCGHCLQCVSGRPFMCEFNWPLNSESRMRNKRGEPLAHMIRVAGFAEYMIVDQSH